MLTVSGVGNSLFMKRGSGLYASARRRFPIRGLTLYIPFGYPELSSSPFLSKDSNIITCTVFGALHLPPKGRYCEGTDDYLQVTNHASLRNLTAKSLFMWVKLTGYKVANQYFLDHNYWTANYGEIMYVSTGANRLDHYIKNTAGASASKGINYTANEWMLVGYSWDGTTMTWFKNGASIGTGSLSGTIECNSNLRLGRQLDGVSPGEATYGEYWEYNRGLALLDAQNIYLSTKWRYV